MLCKHSIRLFPCPVRFLNCKRLIQGRLIVRLCVSIEWWRRSCLSYHHHVAELSQIFSAYRARLQIIICWVLSIITEHNAIMLCNRDNLLLVFEIRVLFLLFFIHHSMHTLWHPLTWRSSGGFFLGWDLIAALIWGIFRWPCIRLWVIVYCFCCGWFPDVEFLIFCLSFFFLQVRLLIFRALLVNLIKLCKILWSIFGQILNGCVVSHWGVVFFNQWKLTLLSSLLIEKCLLLMGEYWLWTGVPKIYLTRMKINNLILISSQWISLTFLRLTRS